MTSTFIGRTILAVALGGTAAAAPAAAQEHEPRGTTYLLAPKTASIGGGTYSDGINRSVRVRASASRPGTEGEVCATITIGDYVEEGCATGVVKIADYPHHAYIKATLPSTYRSGQRKPRQGSMSVIAFAWPQPQVLAGCDTYLGYLPCPRTDPQGPLIEARGWGEAYGTSTAAGTAGGIGNTVHLTVGWPRP